MINIASINGAVRQEPITSTNVDKNLHLHIKCPSHNVFNVLKIAENGMFPVIV